MNNMPDGNTFDIPKKRVQLMIREGATDLEVNRLTNRLVSLAGDSNVFAFNVRRFKEDLSQHMIILFAASGAIGVTLFLMTFFQLTVSMESTMREDS